MNEKAQQLGLTNTHFVTPHGLDQQDHYTTAYELACICDYALKNESFQRVVSTKNYEIHINGKPKALSNTNELLGNLNGVDGVKTGFTNGAGRCLVTSTTRNSHQIICVVLGADTKKIRTKDSIKLIEYAFSNYEYINVKEKIEVEFSNWQQQQAKNIQFWKAKQNVVEYELQGEEIIWMPIPKGSKKDIQVQIKYDEQVEAPILKGYKIGEIRIMLEQEVLMVKDILVKQEIEKKQIGDYMVELIKHYTDFLQISIKEAISI